MADSLSRWISIGLDVSFMVVLVVVAMSAMRPAGVGLTRVAAPDLGKNGDCTRDDHC